MSNEITVQAVSAARANSDAAGEPKNVPVEPLPVALATPTQIPNPNLRLDAALGLVVIEFRNDPGDAVTTSIPSRRQLEAYQRWEQTRTGPAPIARTKGADAAPRARAAEPQPASAPQPSHDRGETKPSS